MVSQGENVLLLSDGVGMGISSLKASGNPSIMYGGQISRGSSTVASGDPVVLVSERLAQGGGGTADVQVKFEDGGGTTTGGVSFLETSQDPSTYYGYADAEVQGDWNEYLQNGDATMAIVHETDRDYYWMFFTYDQGLNAGGGGDVHADWDGLQGSMEVQDDTGGTDSYSTSFPTAHTEHLWGGTNTDGWVVGPFPSGEHTIQYSPTQVQDYNGDGPPSGLRAIGNDKETVETALSTDVTMEVTFEVP